MKRVNFDDVDVAIAGITTIAALYLLIIKDVDVSVIIYAMGLIAALARGRNRGNGEIPNAKAY